MDDRVGLQIPDKWDLRFLSLADFVKDWSRDPSTKVGAVIARGKKVVSLGYNGFPAGVDDSPARYADREQKYPRVVHAEVNAILMARQPLEGCTIYVTPLHPCSSCAGVIIQSGIRRVVTTADQDDARWRENFAIAKSMFDEAGVEVELL